MSANKWAAIRNLEDRTQDCEVSVDIFCGVENNSGLNRCDECFVVYTGYLRDFTANDALSKLSRKGWTHTPGNNRSGFQQWTCPHCKENQ